MGFTGIRRTNSAYTSKKSMKNKIIIAFILTMISSAFFLLPSISLAQDSSYGLNATANNIDAFKGQTQNFKTDFLQTKTGLIISVVLSFVGALFLILMIYAGILWMTAQGNDQQVSKAKGLLMNAIVGMIIVFAAYALTTFLADQVLK